MRDLLTFLQNGGISLDSNNQLHVVRLLSGTWGSHAGKALEALRVMVRTQVARVKVQIAQTDRCKSSW